MNEDNFHGKKKNNFNENSSNNSHTEFDTKVNENYRNKEKRDIVKTQTTHHYQIPYETTKTYKQSNVLDIKVKENESLDEDIDLNDENDPFSFKIVGYAKQVQERIKERANKKQKKWFAYFLVYFFSRKYFENE